MSSKWNSAGELTWGSGDKLYSSDLNDTIQYTTPPIGGVIAWLKSFSGVPSTLPSGWVECNGQTLSDADSPLNGQTIPDLNGDSATPKFLRGATTSGGSGGSETHNHQWATNREISIRTTGSDAGDDWLEEITSFGSDGSSSANSDATGSLYTDNSSSLPTYYGVVWIMRVK